MSTEKRIRALEAESAFEAAAKVIGGWDELRRWASANQSHCKEILLRFVPDGFFKQSTEPTLEDLVVGATKPIHERTDKDIQEYIEYHAGRLNEFQSEVRRRDLLA